MDRKKKRLVKCLTVMCLWVMLLGTLYGCGANNTTKPGEADGISKGVESLKETEPDISKRLESSTETEPSEEVEPSDDIAQLITHAEETAFQQEKNLCGAYELFFGADGGAVFEVTYSSDEDLYYASFSGSMGLDAGSTEGFLSAFTDGTDNIWEYYDNVEFESGNYNPSFRLQCDGMDTIIVTSLDGQTFGGMRFPGFEGAYVRTASEDTLLGTYSFAYADGQGGAELEIRLSDEQADAIFDVMFSGSYDAYAGETEGYMVPCTDGSDGLWEYYDNSDFYAENYNPSMLLNINQTAHTITVFSLDGNNFGGMQFPGFEGTYVRTAE